MQSTKSSHLAPNFFSFRLRHLPDVLLAVLVSELGTITESIEINPIPLSLPSVYGIGYWDGHVVTVLDLAAVLRKEPTAAPMRSNQRIMIAKVAVQGGLQYVGWPIEGNAKVIELKGTIYRGRPSALLDSKFIEESIRVENDNIVILRLAGFFG